MLALNETWLDSSINDKAVSISGYEIERRDRTERSADGKTYGGVCFYVRLNVNFSPRKDMSIDQLENLCIEIRKPNSKPFLVGTWYRPPNSTVEKFDLLGDVNCDIGRPVLDHPTRVLTVIANLYSMHQLISEPTRITETSSTTIDLIFTNDPDKIVCSGVSHIGISDHSLIYSFRKLSTGLFLKRHSTVSYRNFKNFDPESFRNDISSQDWETIKAFSNPNQMWHAWKNMFNNVVHRHAPMRTKRVRGFKSPWISAELKHLMHQRDVLKMKAIKSKNPLDWSVFKTTRNSVNNEIK